MKYNSKLDVSLCDSKYVCNIFNEYISGWIRRDWKLSTTGGSVANQELIKPIYHILQKFKEYKFEWVKGHANIIRNEVVDSIATYCRRNKTSYKSAAEYLKIIQDIDIRKYKKLKNLIV